MSGYLRTVRQAEADGSLTLPELRAGDLFVYAQHRNLLTSGKPTIKYLEIAVRANSANVRAVAGEVDDLRRTIDSLLQMQAATQSHYLLVVKHADDFVKVAELNSFYLTGDILTVQVRHLCAALLTLLCHTRSFLSSLSRLAARGSDRQVLRRFGWRTQPCT